MRLAVTGASGFVGGAVVRAAVAKGWQVHAFGRRRRADGLPPGVPYRSWDLTRGAPPALDVDAVVHCAGSVTDWGPPAEIWRANLLGTEAAVSAFPDAVFVHVSTASVYDPFRPTVMAKEEQAPVARYVNAYGASKAAAERAVMGRAVILRPHAIYGHGDTTLLPRVLRAVRGRHLLAVGTGAQRVSLTSVDNLAQACLLAVDSRPGVYNVTDAEPLTLDEALRAILRHRSVRATPRYIPEKPALALATLSEVLSKRPTLTRYAVGHLAVERTLDITAARRHLGYDPSPTSFEGASAW
ncbi:NAD-dependent epimerase/dehydratase family protein [Nonomuraea sp. NPDC050663]|uniref:NAD-dependent epimerase/dehydratase family protein n=1 Tax=Nonomuraea sp. NPDC050663 TaxID=3364370 RepID=UPI0037AF9D7C